MIDKSLFPKFFAAHRRACLALGYEAAVDCDSYYRKVVLEEARVLSVKAIKTLADFERCLARFAADAGDYRQAVDFDLEKQKRRAYVVRVLAAQIVQLEGYDEMHGRAYIEGVLMQSNLGAGYRVAGPSYWMDLSPSSLWKVLQILDSHLRRLKKRLCPSLSLSFNDRLRFFYDHGKLCMEEVGKYFYTNAE